MSANLQSRPSTPLHRPSARRRSLLGTTDIVLVATVLFYLLMLAVGPISVVDDMADLDLGGGISMTPDGQIKVSGDPAPGPMRIPDESEYHGITMP